MMDLQLEFNIHEQSSQFKLLHKCVCAADDMINETGQIEMKWKRENNKIMSCIDL